YYQPGDVVKGTVRCDYFFGKPVAGARVRLRVDQALGSGARGSRLSLLGPADAQGRKTFHFELPRGSTPRAATIQGKVRVIATVQDDAAQVEKGFIDLSVTGRPLTLSVVAENGVLVPGVTNHVHVIAGYPDGSSARGVSIALKGTASPLVRRRSDSLGVATFDVTPRRGGRRCGHKSMSVSVEARDRLGQRGTLTTCLKVAQAGAVLIRPRKSMVAPGELLEMTLIPAPDRGLSRQRLYVDVVKGGQILATYSRRLRHGMAHVSFQPDATLFGLLELRAYRLTPGGERIGTSRLVFVERPGHLKISITPDRKSYRPGGRAHLAFQVKDSRTGEGVEAALGLLGVDEALIALGGLPEGLSPKRFFSLAGFLSRPGVLSRTGDRPTMRPGGHDLGHWVTAEGTPVKTRARAADVLLAALQPRRSPVWETNPWKDRRRVWALQAPRIIAKAKRFMARHSVGRRISKGWRFRRDLVAMMVRAKVLKSKALNDPWRRVVRPDLLFVVDKNFVFSKLAKNLAPRKLEGIYQALRRNWKSLHLPRERMRKLKRRQWPLVLLPDTLERLVRLGKLKAGDIVDPWGKPYRVIRHKRTFLAPYDTHLISRYHICSAGPDGRFMTKDDIRPRGRRLSVTLINRRGILALRSEDALGGLVGDAIGEAYGFGGLGLSGTGRGGGGAGFGTIGVGSLRTIGHGGGVGGLSAVRVRSKFPETLLWRPEVITDRQGRAAIDVDLADSITTWRVLANASTATGLLGHASTTLRVFQDFFVDIDLPVALTQGDQISVPVTVYNYLKRPQRVTLKLQREGWFTPKGSLTATIDLKPSQVTVRYFPISAKGLGRHDLTVFASAQSVTGDTMRDAIRRSTQVEPDGVEHAIAHGGTLRETIQHALALPRSAIAGTGRVELAMYAGPMGQTIKGMESLLRRPYGCFEQTSSSTYPNVLILDYLRRTKQVRPKITARAKAYIEEGYQKLIHFEVQGGGFSWFGRAPANQILTAYGLMEFFDMARVHRVDPKIVRRTQAWLAGKQRKDGSWAPDKHFINEGATTYFNTDVLRITAYIATALRHTGYQGKVLDRALRYVRAHEAKAKDAYTLATIANLVTPDRDAAARKIFERLWAQRKIDKKGIFFKGPRSTLTYGGGKSGQIEVSALSAVAYLSRPNDVPVPADLFRVIDRLVASKDKTGAWASTQATILSLRALLLQAERSRSKLVGEVEVRVDGKIQRRLRFDGKRKNSATIDLTAVAGDRRRHLVNLRFKGNGNLRYQLVGRYWMPRQGLKVAAKRASGAKSASLSIATSFDRRRVKSGEALQLKVVVKNKGRRRVAMPLVDLALPPGFDLDAAGLATLVKERKVEKVQRVGNHARLYLSKLAGHHALRFSLNLKSKYPLRVQARPSVVYEYYKPENRAETGATTLQVL
ncbi:MAG: hypothetical protein KAI47_09650, partial [Deltaproteobacteria bacterium]|nr:hypothetical protein [Deltaproteobacteria bacterium]